jgi:hypothetical protein
VHGEFGLHSNVTNYKIKLLSKYTTDADFGAKPLYTTAHNDKGAVAATSPNQVQEHEYDNPNPGGGGAASTFDDVIQFDSGMLSDDLYVSVEANAGGALIAADKVKIALVWR